ncbi:MAG: hypothetical protein WEK74_05420, partial [Hydrogenophaga sp.]
WEQLKLADTPALEVDSWLDEVIATFVGGVALSVGQLDFTPDQLKLTAGEDEVEPRLSIRVGWAGGCRCEPALAHIKGHGLRHGDRRGAEMAATAPPAPQQHRRCA